MIGESRLSDFCTISLGLVFDGLARKDPPSTLFCLVNGDQLRKNLGLITPKRV